jgi:tetratricopeptide (TPR) repeat protein
MGWRFRRTLRILPGVRLNISRRGLSASLGVPGARLTLGGKGGPRTTFGLPGTGISYTKTWKVEAPATGATSRGQPRQAPRPVAEERPPLPPGRPGGEAHLPQPAAMPHPPGLVEGLLMPEAERHFAMGVYELWNDRPEAASEAFEAALAKEPRSAEVYFLAGLAERALGNSQAAIDHLENALELDGPLPGPWTTRHAAGCTFSLPIAAAFTAQLDLDEVAAALTLGELYQSEARLRDALAAVETGAQALPDDPAVKLSLGELYVAAGEAESAIRLLAGVQAVDDVTLACRACYAQALLARGLYDAVVEVAGQELDRTAGRDEEILREIRYTRARAWEGKGMTAAAQREYQRLYARDPGYRDVAERVTGGTAHTPYLPGVDPSQPLT